MITLLSLFCCLPLEIRTGVLNPSLFLSSFSFLNLAAPTASNSNHFSCIDPFPSCTCSTVVPLFSHFPPCSSSLALFLLFLTSCCPLPPPVFQFSCVLAHCSASSRPPRSWRQSISRARGVRTRCRLATGCTSCRGHHIGPRCCMSTPPGTTTAKTESPPPTSE